MTERPSAHLAECLEELGWTKQQLAAASRLSVDTVARALRGKQMRARSCAQLVAALNRQRAAHGLAALRASEVFPAG